MLNDSRFSNYAVLPVHGDGVCVRGVDLFSWLSKCVELHREVEWMKHCKAFTYIPKIEAVRNGTCRQTIRPLGKRPVSVGDEILFHGWEGRPYFSKWTWRMRVTINSVTNIRIFSTGLAYLDEDIGFERDGGWNCEVVRRLAVMDGFVSGIEMCEFFNKSYDLKGGKEFQIIRW